jgi:hypothetical protein
MGGSGPTSPTVLYPKALNALAGRRFRTIADFLGPADIELAIQRGEVEGSSKAWAFLTPSVEARRRTLRRPL